MNNLTEQPVEEVEERYDTEDRMLFLLFFRLQIRIDDFRKVHKDKIGNTFIEFYIIPIMTKVLI